jgi:TATA-box binding protein (TBP) (component of TFIID and TFIIIB)
MKNNLKISNIVMSGKIPLKERISVKEFDLLINKFNWMEISMGENYGARFSKKFLIRDKQEISVHHKEKGPYCTIFAPGGIIIVGLKDKKEANKVYDLVLNDLKKVCPKKLILKEVK